MAVFFDTGGDIYGGPTKEAVLAAMRKDLGDEYFIEIEGDIEEVPETMKMRVSDENGDAIVPPEYTTIAEEYDESLGSYCVASSNL